MVDVKLDYPHIAKALRAALPVVHGFNCAPPPNES